VLADGRQSLLGAQRVGARDGRGDDVARGGVAVVGVLAAVGEGGLGRLPAVAERVLVGGQLIEQVVVDVDHADPDRGLGVDHADDAVSEIDVGVSNRRRAAPRGWLARTARSERGASGRAHHLHLHRRSLAPLGMYADRVNSQRTVPPPPQGMTT